MEERERYLGHSLTSVMQALAAADAERLAALDLAGAERARANVEAVREVGAELFC